MNTTKTITALSVSVLLLAGCSLNGTAVPSGQASDPASIPTSGTAPQALVGVWCTAVNPTGYGGWAGDCSGTDIDVGRAQKYAAQTGYGYVSILTNSTATDYRFFLEVSRAAAYLEPARLAGLRPLLVIYFSGHGGQVKDLEGDERDGLDETICLWNGQVTDDLLAKGLAQLPSGLRVAFVSDSCNSGTNYRAPVSWARIYHARATKGMSPFTCEFFHIAGCADGKSSYGDGASGGALSYALFVTSGGPAGKTWQQWAETSATKMPRNQVPVWDYFPGSYVGDKPMNKMEAMR